MTPAVTYDECVIGVAVPSTMTSIADCISTIQFCFPEFFTIIRSGPYEVLIASGTRKTARSRSVLKLEVYTCLQRVFIRMFWVANQESGPLPRLPIGSRSVISNSKSFISLSSLNAHLVSQNTVSYV